MTVISSDKSAISYINYSNKYYCNIIVATSSNNRVSANAPELDVFCGLLFVNSLCTSLTGSLVFDISVGIPNIRNIQRSIILAMYVLF